MKPLQSKDGYLVPKRHAHQVLVLLFLLMAFDLIDRQVLAALMPAIKAEWQLSDTQLGLLVSIVNIAIAVLSLPVAVLVDRWSRKKSIGIMAVVWSLATGACAFAGNYAQMLAARFMVGAGEAGYSAGGTAFLGALYPARLRGTVTGIFQAAAPVGAVIGVLAGGYVATHWGWRHAFGVVAVPGLLLALLVFFVRDYKTVAVEVKCASGAMRKLGWHQALLAVLGKPVLLLLFVSETIQLFFASTISNWLPTFFNRVYALPLDKAGARTALVLLVSGVGTAVGGWLIDRLSRAHPRRRLLGAAAFALLSSVLFIAGLIQPPSMGQMACICAGGFFMLAVLGPVLAALMDMVHPGMRTSTLGILVLVQNLLGMALGPLVTGVLSDRYELQTALLIISFAPLLSVLGFVLVARRYEQGRVGDHSVELTAA